MWIVRLALRRPYTFVVAALTLVLLTPFVLLRMPVDIFPAVDIPVVSAVWLYRGLSAKEVGQRIVRLHERKIAASVNDIDHIESTSYKGAGVIKVYFQPGTSVDAAVAQTASAAQSILRFLPRNITPPIIIRYNATTVPILQYSFASTKLSESELQDIAFNPLRMGLASVPGASVPSPSGGKVRLVAVDLDLVALKASNLAPVDVINAINSQNFILPSGPVKIGPTEYDVALNSSPAVLDDLNDIPIKSVNGAVIRVRDVALVHDGYEPQQSVVRLNGVRGVLVTIFKSGRASTLDVVSGVKQAMPRILSTLPPELHAQEFSDQSVFVRAAVTGVAKEGLIAAALTAFMILLFLGTWRSTLIIAISIPLSILVSVVCLWALGETINLMTLGGLALAVGILVDDATVATENIHAHMAKGKPTVQAILDGAQEIAMPTFVATLCICIVFAPMFFLTGTVRYLFVPLAEAVVFAVLASYVLSRTLLPTLFMWFYRRVEHAWPGGGRGRAAVWLRPFTAVHILFLWFFGRLANGYGRWLATVLHHRLVFAAMFLAFCLGTAMLLPQLGADFFPTVDAGQLRLHLRARSGTRIEETVKLTADVETAIRREIPAREIAGVLNNIGFPSGGTTLTYIDNGAIGTGDADILVSLRAGHRPTGEYVRRLRLRLGHDFPGVTFYFLPADIASQTINFGLPAPFDVQIMGKNQDANRAIASRLAEKLRQVPGMVDVRVQQPANLPRLEFAVDRTKASELGLTERDVAKSMLMGLSGSRQVQPVYWLNPRKGVQYLVNVRVPEHAMDSLAAIEAIPMEGSHPGKGDAELLANLATMQRTNIAPVDSHYNAKPVIDVLAGASGRDLAGILRDVKPLIAEAEKELPRGSFISLRGQAETMNSSFVGLGVGLAMAVVLVYLLLVVNFQSWLDPLVIIAALPAALAGVTWGLYLTFTHLSVPALIGAIMSLGVATANSVLVVTFARNNLLQGMDPLTAAWKGGTGRFRPVLMTALAMIIGMLPMATGMGEGGEQNAPLGRAVVGGLIVATFATLFFVPVMFRLLHRRPQVASTDNLEAVPAAPTTP